MLVDTSCLFCSASCFHGSDFSNDGAMFKEKLASVWGTREMQNLVSQISTDVDLLHSRKRACMKPTKKKTSHNHQGIFFKTTFLNPAMNGVIVRVP